MIINKISFVSKKFGRFTLTELLVVAMVIVVLITLLLPTLRGAIENSVINACKARLRALHMPLEMYTEDHYGLIPRPYYRDRSTLTPGGAIMSHNLMGNEPLGMARLFSFGYLDDGRLYYCPHDMRIYENFASKFAVIDPENRVNQPSGYTFSSYSYRLHYGSHYWKDWAQMSVFSCIAGLDWYPQWEYHHNKKGFSIGFQDGQVAYWNRPEWDILYQGRGYYHLWQFSNQYSSYPFWKAADQIILGE